MTPEQIGLVRDSWKSVEPIAEQAAALFYSKLFELDPSVRPLFKEEMDAQGKKLMQMLAVAVQHLDDEDILVPAVRQLAIRHVGYGVETSHYPTVGAALLWTLEQGLGDAFTEESREAWTAAYGALSGLMISAVSEGEAAPAP